MAEGIEQQTELQKLRADVANIKNVAKKLLKQKQKCESEIKALKQANINCQRENQQFDELQCLYNNLSVNTQDLQNQNNSLKTELDSTKSLLSNKENINVSQDQQEIIRLKKQMEKLRRKIKTSQETASQWKNKYNLCIQDNMSQIQLKNEEINDSSQQYNALKHKYNILAKLKSQQDEYAKSASELQKQLMNETADLKSKFIENEQNCDDLKKENLILKQEKDKRQMQDSHVSTFIYRSGSVILSSLFGATFMYWYIRKYKLYKKTILHYVPSFWR